jgi:hypothetical protein
MCAAGGTVGEEGGVHRVLVGKKPLGETQTEMEG